MLFDMSAFLLLLMLAQVGTESVGGVQPGLPFCLLEHSVPTCVGGGGNTGMGLTPQSLKHERFLKIIKFQKTQLIMNMSPHCRSSLVYIVGTLMFKFQHIQA